MLPVSTPSSEATLHWMDEESSPYQNISLNLVDHNAPLQFDVAPPKPHKAREQWIFTEYDYLYANFTFTRRLTARFVSLSTITVAKYIFMFHDITVNDRYAKTYPHFSL